MKKGMPFYMSIPKDLSRVKSKFFFKLTLRQTICFSIAALIGIPLYLYIYTHSNSTVAMFAIFITLLPIFFIAIYEKDGMPAEMYFKHIIHTLQSPKERPYKTNNYYTFLSKQIQVQEEVENIVFLSKKFQEKRTKNNRRKFTQKVEK